MSSIIPAAAHRVLIATIAAAFALIALASAATAQDDTDADPAAPFQDIRFDDHGARILLDGAWFRWLAIDGISFDTLRAESLKRHGARWQKRIAEDLVELLADIGSPPGFQVMLRLQSLDDEDGGAVEVAALMTTANRRAVWEARDRREREATLDQQLDTQAVFEELAQVIAVNHAYATLRLDDVHAEAQRMIERLGPSVDRRTALLEARALVASLGDGHARIDDWREAVPAGYLSCLVECTTEGIVAYRPDRSGFVDPDHPFLTMIDDQPLALWTDAALRFVTNGSPQYRRERSVAGLQDLNLLRRELGLDFEPTVTLTLANARGETIEVTLPVSGTRLRYGSWPLRETGVLPNSGIGYLRITSMSLDEGQLKQLRSDLHALLDQPALIIDVRTNGGGDRHAMRVLLPYFMQDDVPRVVNVARFRLPGDLPAEPEDGSYMENRLLYSKNSDRWTADEKAAIDRFARTFKPAWQPAGGFEGFSVWHYDVVSSKRFAPTRDPFTGPVVILMDESCYSATDIFLGAFKGLPNVTLLGQPSGGGSARSQPHRLEELNATVVLASMASFQPNGLLYDLQGITPDVLVDRQPTDLLGRTDTQLEAAVELLSRKLQSPD